MVDTWINHSVYSLLERIGSFSFYFQSICKWFAAVCFFMALLMAVIKIFLGIADAREQIIKLLVTTCFYFILMFIYPIAMKAILPFAMNLGYGAVFYTAQQNIAPAPGENEKIRTGTQADFYKWLGKNTNNIFQVNEIKDVVGNVTGYQLNMGIVDKNTGYYDFNKILTFMIAFLHISFMLLPKITFFNISLIEIATSLFYLLSVAVVFVCLIIVLVNYVMCLIDYFALMGFGVLMIPLSLWDGTKSYTEKLYGSIGSILIKLMVISAFMYLAIMVVIDIFAEVYNISAISGKKGTVMAIPLENLPKMIELCVTLCIQGFLMHTVVTNTEKIAGFLNGGSPSMSFGDAAKGLAGMIATGAMAGAGGKAVANAVGDMNDAAVRSVASGVAAKIGGGNVFSSSMKSLGSSIARSTVGGIKNAPSAIKNGLTQLANATGATRAVGGEGFTTGKDFGGGGTSGGGSSAGGGNSGSGSAGGGSSAGGGNSGGGSAGGGNSSGGSTEGSSSGGGSAENGGATGGNNEGLSSTQSSSEGSSGGSSESSGGTENSGNNSESSSATGNTLYGDTPFTSDGGFSNFGDSLKSKADALSQSDSALDRRKGAVLGTAGAIMSNLNSYKKERNKGNVVGNSNLNAIADGIKQGVKGRIASSVNAKGGMTVSFKNDHAMTKKNGGDNVMKVKSQGGSAKTSFRKEVEQIMKEI